MARKHLQNRVNPWGIVCSVPSRGALMGNRGILHDDNNNIVRPWAHKGWVICLTAFKGIKRPRPFSKGNYSELFFLDEATALSAGHRPCAHCQRDRNEEFKKAWLNVNISAANCAAMRMPDIDKILHAERAIRGGGKVTFDSRLDALPVGTMFEHDGNAFLVASRGYLPWSFDGYGAPHAFDGQTQVRVLTPRSVVKTFAANFVPHMHPSAIG